MNQKFVNANKFVSGAIYNINKNFYALQTSVEALSTEVKLSNFDYKGRIDSLDNITGKKGEIYTLNRDNIDYIWFNDQWTEFATTTGYVQYQNQLILNDAKQYADQQDNNFLLSGKTYTDQKSNSTKTEAILEAEQYAYNTIKEVSGITLNQSKIYTDQGVSGSFKFRGILTGSYTWDQLEEIIPSKIIGDVYSIQKLDQQQNVQIVYTNKGWIKLGSTIDLSPYATINYVSGQLNTKVDKVQGKQLTTEDYTTAQKNKLADIQANAQVNVLQTIKVNGIIQDNVDKTVNVNVPTGLLQLNEKSFNSLTDKPTTISGYSISDAYTKTQVDDKIKTQVASVFRWKGRKQTLAEVQALTDAVVGDVWAVIEESNRQYVFTNSSTGGFWEPIGYNVDISTKLDKSEFDSVIVNYAKIVDVNTALSTKVDVVQGKSLIADEKITKLDNIEQGAQVNIIEKVNVDNVELEIIDKTVNIVLSSKVDKVQGKSLIADSEIARLSSVTNYDDTGIKSNINVISGQVYQSMKFKGSVDTLPGYDNYNENDVIIVTNQNNQQYIKAKNKDGNYAWITLGNDKNLYTKAEVDYISGNLMSIINSLNGKIEELSTALVEFQNVK